MEQPVFIGEEPFDSYLPKLCTNMAQSPDRIGLVLIQDDSNSQHQLHKQLLRLNCEHILISLAALNYTSLIGQLHRPELSRPQYLNLMFETSLTSAFESMLLSLAQVYRECANCVPFIILLDTQIQRLHQWTSSIIGGLRSLRAIIVTNRLSDGCVLHLNPTLDGCFEAAQVFMPKSRYDFDRFKVPYQRCNLKNTTLNVSINRLLPYCDIIRRPTGLETKFGMETELLKVMQRSFNFQVNFIDGRQRWGDFSNGSWTGMLGQVLNYTSDVAMCEFTLTETRSRVADFSRFILQNEITFISQSPGLKERNWIVAAPFSIYIWISIITCVMGLSGFLFAAHKYAKHLEYQPYGDVWGDIYSIVLQESTIVNRKAIHFSMRIVYGLWICMALVLSSSYGSSFYSILTVPEYEAPVDTIEDISSIARTDHKYLIVKENSSNWFNFLNSNSDNAVYYLIGQHLNRTGQALTTSLVDFMPQLDASSKYVVIANRIVLRIHRQQYANRSLHLGMENLGIDFTGYVFRKRSPLQQPFNMMIVRMREMAIIQKWIAKTFAMLDRKFDPSDYKSDESELVSFNLKTLQSIFILWLIGIGSSMTGFLLEVLLMLYNK